MLHGFIGALGGPEIVVLLLIVGFPIVIVFIIVAVVRASKKSGGPPPIAGGPLPITRESTTQARLNELEALRTSGAITESEYEEKRGEILNDL